TQAEIRIQLPTLIPSEIKCLTITDSNGNVQSISEDYYVAPNDYFNIPNYYMAQKGLSYKFAFYSGSPNSGSSCSGNFLVETDYLIADVTNSPWSIERNEYSVRIKVQVSEKEYSLGMLVLYNGNYVYKYEEYRIDKRDDNGYYYIDYLVYKSAIYAFCASPKGASCDACEFSSIPNMAVSPWTITGM
ncbi:19725_t:CDS:2, partial [Gigaspora rosea]